MSTSAFDKMLAAAGFTAEDPQELKDISVLLYGGAGSGKTSFSATASRVPEMSPVLYLDFERGTLPLREWGELDKITIIHLDSWADTHRFISQVVRPTMNSRSFPYRTVVFDTIDKLQELIVGESRTANPGNNYKPWTDAYDNAMTLINAFMRCDGVNLLALTHVARVTNSVTGETEIGPAFRGQQSDKHMPSNFDFVAYMRSGRLESGKFAVRADFALPGAITKRRVKDFPDFLENPTMGRVWMLAHNTEATTSTTTTNKENA